MLDGKMRLIGVFMLSGFLMTGCTGDDDDATVETSPTPGPEASGTPAPEATPEYLDFDTVDTYVECITGTNEWYYQLSLIGWAEDYPYVIVYDNPEADYAGGDPDKVWTEDISLDILVDEGGDSTNAGYYQVWVRDDLLYVETSDDYVEDYNTIFMCDNLDWLTFVFYASDYWDGWEDCYAIGYLPETFGPGCLY